MSCAASGPTRQERLRQLLLAEPSSHARVIVRTGWTHNVVRGALALGLRNGVLGIANDELGKRCYYVLGFAPEWLRNLPGALPSPHERQVLRREGVMSGGAQ